MLAIERTGSLNGTKIPTPEQIREMLPEVKPPVFNYGEYRRITLALAAERDAALREVCHVCGALSDATGHGWEYDCADCKWHGKRGR